MVRVSVLLVRGYTTFRCHCFSPQKQSSQTPITAEVLETLNNTHAGFEAAIQVNSMYMIKSLLKTRKTEHMEIKEIFTEISI